jgi:hypothetical protein
MMKAYMFIALLTLSSCATVSTDQRPDPLLDLAPMIEAGSEDLMHASRDPERLRQEAGHGLEQMVEGAGCGCVEGDSSGGFSDPGSSGGPPDIDPITPATLKINVKLPQKNQN